LKFVLRPAGTLPAAEVEVLKLLLNAESVEIAANYEPPKGTPSASNSLGVKISIGESLKPALSRVTMASRLSCDAQTI